MAVKEFTFAKVMIRNQVSCFFECMCKKTNQCKDDDISPLKQQKSFR